VLNASSRRRNRRLPALSRSQAAVRSADPRVTKTFRPSDISDRSELAVGRRSGAGPAPALAPVSALAGAVLGGQSAGVAFMAGAFVSSWLSMD
jgi:hypothetical protein